MQQQAANANASMQNAKTSLNNANSAYQNTLSSVTSDFITCATRSGLLFAPVNALLCGPQLASSAISIISSAFTTAIRPFYEALGLSLNSVTATTIPMVTSTGQQIRQTIQGAGTQAANIVQQMQACMPQAAKATAANTNATAANANATAVNANATAMNATGTSG
jgi:hypothetical protein